jgi:O-antigen ligase/polysaccharide polymerase Wzy-like membrane protein
MTCVASASRPIGLNDRYLVLLSGVLFGYAMIGKGFAYLGLPPLFIGELALLTGFLVLLRTGCLIAALATLPSLILAATMTWVVLRTLPFVGGYGFDALRDSVVIMYGVFAFIVIALLLEDGSRINTILRYYGAFLSIYVPTIPFVFAFSRYMAEHMPLLPGSNVPVLQVQSTEIAVHLTGAAVFALVGLRKVTRLWLVFLLAGLVMVGALGRGAMLAEVLPITAATLLLGKWRQLALAFLVGLVAFSAAYAVEPIFFDSAEATSSDERPFSTRQVVDNVTSIVGQGGAQTESTKEWRLAWWDVITANTVFGPHFWTGRGFGLNLAEADGFRTDRSTGPALRSPHNVHMTILARAGVPGAALWTALLASWFAMLASAVLTARRRGHAQWAGLFLFIACYVASMIINATFDVALEGPMQGVWFWSMIGFGIGSVMVYRHQHMASRSVVADNPEPRGAS